jgi:seryl-tRNA synthetase
VKALDARLGEVEAEQKKILLEVPNVPLPDVPVGKDAADNVEVKKWGERRTFAFDARPHWEVAERLGFFDFARGAKLTGSHWPVYMGLGARFERALIQMMLDFQTRERGYVEVSPPFVVNRDTMVGTGQLPKFEEDMYRINPDDLFLIPTAEVPLTNLHREETLAASELPKRYAGYTPCYRREAGAYGKDTRGIQRVHQFDKVELVKICAADQAEAEHEGMLADATAVCERLGLEHRVIVLCTGDMGFGSAKTYDIEVWAPVTGRWFECSSVSQCGEFQARRLNLRYRTEAKGPLRFCHTLNGSGLATPRVLIALLETYQRADGGLDVPEALRSYMGGMERVEALAR